MESPIDSDAGVEEGWSELPRALLQLILEPLDWLDSLHAREACRAWRSGLAERVELLRVPVGDGGKNRGGAPSLGAALATALAHLPAVRRVELVLGCGSEACEAHAALDAIARHAGVVEVAVVCVPTLQASPTLACPAPASLSLDRLAGSAVAALRLSVPDLDYNAAWRRVAPLTQLTSLRIDEALPARRARARMHGSCDAAARAALPRLPLLRELSCPVPVHYTPSGSWGGSGELLRALPAACPRLRSLTLLGAFWDSALAEAIDALADCGGGGDGGGGGLERLAIGFNTSPPLFWGSGQLIGRPQRVDAAVAALPHLQSLDLAGAARLPSSLLASFSALGALTSLAVGLESLNVAARLHRPEPSPWLLPACERLRVTGGHLSRDQLAALPRLAHLAELELDHSAAPPLLLAGGDAGGGPRSRAPDRVMGRAAPLDAALAPLSRLVRLSIVDPTSAMGYALAHPHVVWAALPALRELALQGVLVGGGGGGAGVGADGAANANAAAAAVPQHFNLRLARIIGARPATADGACACCMDAPVEGCGLPPLWLADLAPLLPRLRRLSLASYTFADVGAQTYAAPRLAALRVAECVMAAPPTTAADAARRAHWVLHPAGGQVAALLAALGGGAALRRLRTVDMHFTDADAAAATACGALTRLEVLQGSGRAAAPPPSGGCGASACATHELACLLSSGNAAGCSYATTHTPARATLTDGGVRALLASAPRLRRLALHVQWSSDVAGAGLGALSTCTALTHLSLCAPGADNAELGAALAAVAGLRRLRRLALWRDGPAQVPLGEAVRLQGLLAFCSISVEEFA